MSEVFADTSGWASAFVRTETYHAAAASYLRQWQSDGTLVVTTNYVINEVSALLTSSLRVPRPQQIAILNSIWVASWVEVVHVDPALDSAAHRLFQSRPDKLWSLVDCASFVVMEQRGITSAFTNDHHFEQAGLLRLLK
jgi:predicted nucleic acid-binding protein